MRLCVSSVFSLPWPQFLNTMLNNNNLLLKQVITILHNQAVPVQCTTLTYYLLSINYFNIHKLTALVCAWKHSQTVVLIYVILNP